MTLKGIGMAALCFLFIGLLAVVFILIPAFLMHQWGVIADIIYGVCIVFFYLAWLFSEDDGYM